MICQIMISFYRTTVDPFPCPINNFNHLNLDLVWNHRSSIFHTMEKLTSLIAILLVVVFAVSVNSSEIYRFEPSIQNDPSHLKCLQFWSNGPLTHCKLIFEAQELFYIGLKTKPEGLIGGSTEVQVIIENEHGKNEKFSITTEELSNQYWSQDFDKNEASRIIFKITRDGKEIDKKEVENLIDYVEIRGYGLNSKPIQQNQENLENLENLKNNQEIEPTSDEDEDDEYDTFTDEPTNEPTTTETISTTDNPLGPETDLDELDTELGTHWTSSCKFYNTITDFQADNCPYGNNQPIIPPITSRGFWAPCTQLSCEIEYKNPDSEISNAEVNIYIEGGEINPPLEGQKSYSRAKFTKFQMKQAQNWLRSNLTLPSATDAKNGLIKMTLTAGVDGVVIIDKVQIYGRSRALPVDDDDTDTLLIVLLSVGSVIIVCIFAGGVYFYIRYKKQNKYNGKGKDRPLDHYQNLSNYQEDEGNYGSSRRDRGGQINESYIYNDELARSGGPRSRPVSQYQSQNQGQGQSQFQSQTQQSNQYLPRFEPTGALPRVRLNETASMSTRSNLGGPSFRRTEQY